MKDTINKIEYARIKLGIPNQFLCRDNPQTEEDFNNNVKWIIGEDEYRNAVYTEDRLITWQQVQEFAEEACNEWALRKLREERDRRLAETDWWAVADRTMSDEQKAYRQALRDITDTSSPALTDFDQLDIESVNWPVRPQ